MKEQRKGGENRGRIGKRLLAGEEEVLGKPGVKPANKKGARETWKPTH
jgi:hypothetical protein